MLTFKYDKSIDEECWGRIIKAGNLFGHDFPKTFFISENDILTAQEKAIEYQIIWNNYSHNFNANLKKIYKYDFPAAVACYINSSPYSMDNYASNYISISMKLATEEKIVSTIIHEACHFLFRKYYIEFCGSLGCSENEIEEIKEVITVVNNVVFPKVHDYGWKIHHDIREKVLVLWKRNEDIEKIIRETIFLLRNKG